MDAHQPMLARQLPFPMWAHQEQDAWASLGAPSLEVGSLGASPGQLEQKWHHTICSIKCPPMIRLRLSHSGQVGRARRLRIHL